MLLTVYTATFVSNGSTFIGGGIAEERKVKLPRRHIIRSDGYLCKLLSLDLPQNQEDRIKVQYSNLPSNN